MLMMPSNGIWRDGRTVLAFDLLSEGWSIGYIDRDLIHSLLRRR
jgi:hypothetical protein